MLPACATLTIVAAISEESVMKQTLSSETARVRRGQLRAVALGIGVSAMAFACSFGEIDNGEKIDPPSTPADTGANPGNDGDAPGPSVTPGPKQQPGSPGNTPGSTTAAVDPNDPFENTDLGKEVKQILEVNCAGCHQGTKSGDMDYILQLKDLILNDKVVP